MTRIGRNPLSGNKTTVPPPPEFSLCMLTHYTDDAYHRFRVPVIDLCVQTYRAGAAGKDYELIIWDNGSTADFRQHLFTYKPDVLILSPNVGKSSARLGLAHIARGKVFCFSDDDIFYYDGWLNAHLDLLYHFPAPVMISGSPYRLACNNGTRAIHRFATRPGAILVEGQNISEEDERLYSLSLGNDWERHKLRIAAATDYILEWNGKRAYGHGHHMQFVTWREDVLPFLRPSEVYLDNERHWEQYLDDNNYLRLTTLPRSTWHIGNELTGDVIIANGQVILNKKKEG